VVLLFFVNPSGVFFLVTYSELLFGMLTFAGHAFVAREWYVFSQPFEPPVVAFTSFYVGILTQKATWLGRLLDFGQ
jgi:hypothetical protein